ncbi:phosphate ABC transporter substrate-binding protein [Streptomyces sp. GSL17-111]|uniref:phosphate ABC transporter substrate-binding protein n=1 Tax=Streptomyces sp. GSL17-111 TaxID=3121596 RepID=UPI00404087BD
MKPAHGRPATSRVGRLRRRVLPAALCLFGSLLASCAGSDTQTSALNISGSTTVAPVAADAAEALRERGLEATVATQGGSAGGISQLGSGQIDIAMSSKPLQEEDRSAHPGASFHTTQVGTDAVGVIITRKVADAGVDNLTKTQVRDLFEGKITNWSELGGPDLAVFVYDKEPGRGTREALDSYLYGEATPPPPPETDNFAIVGGNLETRSKLKSTSGSIAPLSTGFVEGHDDLVAVTLDGVSPDPENIASGDYPMTRPLYLVTDGRPEGKAKEFIDYVLSGPGQELLTRHGYLTLDQLGK